MIMWGLCIVNIAMQPAGGKIRIISDPGWYRARALVSLVEHMSPMNCRLAPLLHSPVHVNVPIGR